VFEAYIEIDTTDTWNFVLLVEDYDGYIHNYFNWSSPTDDGYIEIDFSSAVIGTTTPGNPTIISVSTTYTREIGINFNPPTNSEWRWDLELQIMTTEGDWGSSIVFKGSETYQWDSSETYYIEYILSDIISDTNVGVRIRFVNDGTAGNWVYGAGTAIAYSSAPSQPSYLSISTSNISGVEILTLTCAEVSNATGYDWQIASNSSGTGPIKSGSTSINEISFFGPHEYNWEYALVRAKNEAGESLWRYISTGW
jgi:hypothetical protein